MEADRSRDLANVSREGFWAMVIPR
jgi:hypothetical protein